MNKKVAIIVLIMLASLFVILGVASLLNYKFHFFADEADPGCSMQHPYTIKAGKQIYMDGQTEIDTGFPGVPKDYLVRIPRVEIKNELADYADDKTIVCYKSGSSLAEIPSFEESGELWFQIQDDIPQNSEAQYFVSNSVQPRRLSLVGASDIDIHPFNSESTFSSPPPANPFWTRNFWQGLSSANFSMSEQASPGGSDTLKISNFAGYADPAKTDWGVSLGGVRLISYDPTTNADQKDTYYLKVGWAKYAGIEVSRDENGVSSQGARYYSRLTDYTSIAGRWAGGNLLYVSDNVDTDWDRFAASTILRDQPITTGIQVTAQNLSAGEIFLSSFKFIKNIKAPRELKKTVTISSKSQEVSWRENKVAYFGSELISPLKTTTYQGAAFEVGNDTKLYLTNNFAEYYKDHYDGSELILTSKLKSAFTERNLATEPIEIEDFKPGKSIFIGDLENEAFKAFVYKLCPDIAGLSFQQNGFRIFVGEKYIIALGKDMVGSYYAALRLADLIKTNVAIGQRTEEDYPENSFRSLYSWNFTQREKNAEVIKEDIRKASALRYNVFALNGPNEFQAMNSTTQQTLISGLFTYARKYFMEPMPSGFSARDVYYKDGSFKANAALSWAEREIEIDPATKSGYLSIYVTEKYTNDPKTEEIPEESKPPIPIRVKLESSDPDDKFAKGSDFIIEQKARPSDGKNAYYITLTPQSTIWMENMKDCSFNASKKCLKVTFNGVNYENHISNRISLPAVRDYIQLGINNVYNYGLNPKYIHITNDELANVASDYRDIYNPDGTPTGNTPSSMFADFINDLYTTVNPTGQPKRSEVIMWADMLNPYQQTGWNYSANRTPYTFGAIDMIPKDIILDQWFFTPGSSLGCQQGIGAAEYHIDKGFRVIMGPTTEASHQTYGCFNQLSAQKHDKVMGFYIPEWIEEKDDKVVGPIRAKQIWSYSAPQSSTGEAPIWEDDSPVHYIERFNVEEGQVIKTNPYQLSVKVQDPSRVAKVEYYVDSILIGTSTLPDINGFFDWPWDTSKYHSLVKIVVYGTDGTTEEITRNTRVELSEGEEPPIVTILPKTGENNLAARFFNALRSISAEIKTIF